MLTGQWTYRSYHNSPDLVNVQADLALRLIFGEGVMRITQSSSGYASGKFDMGGGFELALVGSTLSGPSGAIKEFELTGRGIAKSPTDGWQYDYRGIITHTWPNGVDQVPTLIGTVIRALPHGSAPAGYVASFICVKRANS